MKTNKWQLDTTWGMNRVIITRIEDNLPVCEMMVSSENGDGLMEYEQATDVANQIIDNWNFECEEIE